jgi:hypothetical protein
LERQGVHELTDSFERHVSGYLVAVQGEVRFDHSF